MTRISSPGSLPANGIQELVLQTQWFIGHFYCCSSSLVAQASAFACGGAPIAHADERGRAGNVAGESADLDLQILALKKLSASLSGDPMIAIDAPPSPASQESMISGGSRSTSMQPTRSPGVESASVR